MRRHTWRLIGFTAYWLLLPLIYVYAAVTKPRARVLIIHDNHALVVKNWLGAGGWALPGGGIEPEESPAAAAIREIQEELGFVIEPGALQELGEYISIEKGGLKTKYHLFSLELIQRPELVIKTDEIVDHKWVPITDLVSASKGVSNTVKQSLETWSRVLNLLS
jgi:8-oxo-dGTP pyrophosphatase MutT (NUDIX family)